MEERIDIKKGLFAVVMGILYVIFFMFYRLGVNVLIYNVLLLGLGYFVTHKQPNFNKTRFFLLGALIIYLSVPAIRYDFQLFPVLNTFLIIGLYGLLLAQSLTFNLFDWIKTMFFRLVGGLSKLTSWWGFVRSVRGEHKEKVMKLVLGLVITMLLLSVILPLLLSSDVVFKQLYRDLFDFANDDFYEWIFKILVGSFLAAYIFGQVSWEPAVKETMETIAHMPFDKLIAGVVLGSLNGVYGIYVFIQIKYLFLGNTLPDGMTYADYARTGFFQLVFVTFLNMMVIIVINHMTETKVGMKSLLTFMLVMTIIMGIAAFYRMHLYESAYGYTRLRVLVYLFLIGEGLAMIPIVIGVWRRTFAYLEWATLAVLVLYLGYNLINIDAFVAEENMKKYLKDGVSQEADQSIGFDFNYLGSLSKDAFPVIKAYWHELNSEEQALVTEWVKYHHWNFDSDYQWFEWRLVEEQWEE